MNCNICESTAHFSGVMLRWCDEPQVFCTECDKKVPHMSFEQYIQYCKKHKLSRQQTELMTYLNLTQDDLIATSIFGIDVGCDYCDLDIRGGTKHTVYDNSRILDVCDTCFDKHKLTDAEKEHLVDYYDTYKYKFIFIHKVSNDEYVYIVEEKNNCITDRDCHYYLKIVKNKEIILDHELMTYNPYFGIYDIYITKFQDNKIAIKYHEKHFICKVELSYDGTVKSNNYLYSMPKMFSRFQNPLTIGHEIGNVVKFVKNGIVMENKKYF